jgi:thioredoxin-dependent peroxiredoxin
MLRVGAKAPVFELSDQHGEVVRLVDLVSKGPLVLYFYPADFTPG